MSWKYFQLFTDFYSRYSQAGTTAPRFREKIGSIHDFSLQTRPVDQIEPCGRLVLAPYIRLRFNTP